MNFMAYLSAGYKAAGWLFFGTLTGSLGCGQLKIGYG
jgi:hypothetical protein